MTLIQKALLNVVKIKEEKLTEYMIMDDNANKVQNIQVDQENQEIPVPNTPPGENDDEVLEITDVRSPDVDPNDKNKGSSSGVKGATYRRKASESNYGKDRESERNRDRDSRNRDRHRDSRDHKNDRKDNRSRSDRRSDRDRREPYLRDNQNDRSRRSESRTSNSNKRERSPQNSSHSSSRKKSNKSQNSFAPPEHKEVFDENAKINAQIHSDIMEIESETAHRSSNLGHLNLSKSVLQAEIDKRKSLLSQIKNQCQPLLDSSEKLYPMTIEMNSLLSKRNTLSRKFEAYVLALDKNAEPYMSWLVQELEKKSTPQLSFRAKGIKCSENPLAKEELFKRNLFEEGSLMIIRVDSMNEQKRSVTVHLCMNELNQIHKNMQVRDALSMIQDQWNIYSQHLMLVKIKRNTPPSHVSTGLKWMGEGKQLKVAQYDAILGFVMDKRSRALMDQGKDPGIFGV